MLRGFVLIALWFAVLCCAMVESALRFASRSRLEEIIESPRRRKKYFGYLDKAGVVDAFCILVRVCAIVGFAMLVAAEIGGRYRGIAAGVVAAIVMFVGAELPGRVMGRRWSAGVLLVLLPPFRWASVVLVPFQLAGRRIL
ncbi:unnamed protein product, partial [marine sediment metagenome]